MNPHKKIRKKLKQRKLRLNKYLNREKAEVEAEAVMVLREETYLVAVDQALVRRKGEKSTKSIEKIRNLRKYTSTIRKISIVTVEEIDLELDFYI